MPEFPDKDTDVLTDSKTKLEKPKLFKVLLHNDDFTTMDFVVFVLQYVFMRDVAEAVGIMLKVHNEGVGLAGVYPYEIATTKALFAAPQHPYTRALLSAIPVLDPDAPRERVELKPDSFDRNATLSQVGDGHWAAV